MIFSISSTLDKATKIMPEKMIALNIWERQHIEEWVRQSPEILGEELLILAVEFDRFVQSDDRLDILALDRDGNLVVVELKRDLTAGFADLQAIRYAAMVSSMKIDTLLPYYVSYRKKAYGEQISLTDARDQIIDFVESDTFSDFSTKPRIILCSEGFSYEITTTVLWLRASQIDISCVTITPYKVGESIVIVPKVIIPLAEAKQYLIEIQEKTVEREQSSRTARPKTNRILIENKLVQAGDKLYLKNLPSYIKYLEGDPTFQATITGKLGQGDFMVWAKDGAEYAISALTWKIFKQLHPEQKDPPGINGNVHWVTESGKSLWELAEDFLEKKLST
jgi:hypothetical protein